MSINFSINHHTIYITNLINFIHILYNHPVFTPNLPSAFFPIKVNSLFARNPIIPNVNIPNDLCQHKYAGTTERSIHR